MEPRPAINRVQPDFLDKRYFIPVEYDMLANPESGATPTTLSTALIAREPIFYTQTTIIAKPPTTGFTGVTSYSEAQKIRWEVTENFLIARRALEFLKNVPGSDNGSIGQRARVGEVLASYRIASHFDIRRDYNTSTGEELNVVVENSSDRPWYMRRYMRVDWSQNLITGYASPLEYEEWTGAIQAEPVPVFVNNPNDPNAPVFEYKGEGENRELKYFDIVNRAVMHPETFSWGSDYPNVPSCFLTDGAEDCAPAELTFRMSFRRSDPTRDYEPMRISLPWPNDTSESSKPGHWFDMERFGFFDQMRIGFDNNFYTPLNTQRVHYASRHNLWMRHHAVELGADTAAACSEDSDCGAGQLCHFTAPSVGVCAAATIHHLGTTDLVAGTDVACVTDFDCRRSEEAGTGVSNTAVCDSTTRTCGEYYFRCETDAQCQTKFGQNSMCDTAISSIREDNRGLCTLPFSDRVVRQVAYHVTPNYPEYMQGVTESVVANWNDAFRKAVGAARRHECEITMGADPTNDDPATNPCVARQNVSEFVFVGCHSPVWGVTPAGGSHTQAEVDAAHAKGWDLTEACGPEGTNARLGDLRYSSIGGIVEYDRQGYWGLANIASDPETGEMIAGRGAVWQTVTDSYAAYTVQLARVLNGEVLPEQIADGSYLVDFMRHLGTGHTAGAQTLDAPLQLGGMGQIHSGLTGLDSLRLPGAGWFTPDTTLTLNRQRGSTEPSAWERLHGRLRQGRSLGDGANLGAAHRASLRGTEIESRLMTDMQVQMAPGGSRDPSGLSAATLEAASPFRGQDPAARLFKERIRTALSAWECGYRAAESFDDVMLSLARRLWDPTPITPQSEPEASYGQTWNFVRENGERDFALMQRYVANFIHQGVLAHEIGHSLGQRHNFTASADAVNYHDPYWEVRGRGHASGLRPRYEYLADPADGHYYSNEEINGRVDEFSYASVMDYKGFTEDAHGLGKYDYAFIKGGYVGMVEAFKTVADQQLALVYSVNTAGNGNSSTFDLSRYAQGQIRGVHYTQIPQIFGTVTSPSGAQVPNIRTENRYNVFVRETKSVSIPYWGPPSFSNVTNDDHVLVPYRFDSDNRANLVWVDQRNDSGADAFESLHYVAERYINLYPFNSYARGRVGFSTGSYVDRMWGRYADQLHQTAQMTMFDLIAYDDFFHGEPGWNDYLNNPANFGGYINQLAFSEASDTFATLLTMPEMGNHFIGRTNADLTTFITPDFNQTGLNIDITQGRVFESAYRYDAGFWWSEELDRVGAYYDKMMSLENFTTPELYLIGRDTPTDIRFYQLNWYTVYPNQMIRFVGGILSEDYEDFAPIIATTGDNELRRTHLATINLPPGAGTGQSGRVIDATHKALDPQTHFTAQLMSAVYTAAGFSATFDQRYMDMMRLWADGADESITVENPDVNTVSFTDPWTHLTYRALHFGTNPGESGAAVGASALRHPSLTNMPAAEAGIGARMILHLADLDQRRRTTAGNVQAEIEREEHKYIDLINVMRLLTRWHGGGYVTLP